MRFRTLGLAAALSVALFHPSDAVVPQKGAEPPVVAAGQAPRSHREVAYGRSAQLDSSGLRGWRAIWDQDTGVPLRLWGSGVVATNAARDAAAAEAAARAFLAAHLPILAPGASVDDFVLIANQASPDGVRSVGFEQRYRGLRVVSGAIGFSFKADRLVMVNSTALPNISATVPATQLSPSAVYASATQWLAKDAGATAIAANLAAPTSERVIVPVVRPRIGLLPDINYRVTEQVALVDADGAGSWDVWIDSINGAPVMRKTKIQWGTGKVVFDTPDRGPQGARHPQPASLDTFTVNGAAVTSLADGTVTWTGTAPATVALGLSGPIATIINKAGAVFTQTLSLTNAGTVTFSGATDGLVDAQLDAYVFVTQAKAFAKARINPTLAWLDGNIKVSVNDSRTCNAQSNGDDILFFVAGNGCENTGRISDVVYHEFGHSLHNNSIIPGVGQFNASLSEGLADTLALLLTGDPGLGRGFRVAQPTSPLRNLEPATPKQWQGGGGEVHDEGEIIGEALWDMRKALEAKLGQAAGYEQTIRIYYGIMQRASDIPSSFAEALVADDDDGNLTNGTPNLCEITNAFGRHALSDSTATLSVSPPTRDNFHVSITATPGASAAGCPGPTVMSAVVDWQTRGGGAPQQVMLAASGNDFAGDIPTQPEGAVVQYRVTMTLSDGSVIGFPDNPADPLYEFYVGPVIPLFCADFEAGASDWMHGATPATSDEWQSGAPMGLGGDPKVAHGGTAVLGIDLMQDGVYKARITSTFAESPEIDLKGNTHVRLQYYRWLGVEDGFYDKARIVANDTPVWNNFTSITDPMSDEVNHVDKEWRFQDVDLSAQAATGKLKLRFELTSDPGLHLGGWTVDDVCIVAMTGAALTCGNGSVDDGESCDDGNRLDGDGCSANCIDEAGGGCCSVGSGPEGAVALSMLTFGVLLRRRRRPTSAACATVPRGAG